MFLKNVFTSLIWIISVCLGSFLHATDHSIVFIHIGPNLPAYAKTAFSQARLFNPDCPIFLIASQAALETSTLNLQDHITTIACESLQKTTEHRRFINNSRLTEGFWRSASERFLYLHDFMNQYNVNNVFHLEYDNMLYVNLSDLLPIFQKHYPGIGATFDNDERCIPGFVYISSPRAIKELAKCFVTEIRYNYNDMQLLAIFKKKFGDLLINHLPIVSEEYAKDHELKSTEGHTVRDPKKYFHQIQSFDSIFDAAALGQYLGGVDPRNDSNSKPGFINESCIFNPSFLSYEWIEDAQGRKVPYAIYGTKSYRINNLHIHSKKLSLFTS